MHHLGQTIRTLRQQRGWHQEELARRLGLSTPSLSKIENGICDVNYSRLKQLAAAFELSVAELLGYGLEVVPGPREALSSANSRLRMREAEVAGLQQKISALSSELQSSAG